jgi:hypothetical protein
MHQLHTSLDTRVLLPVATQRKKCPGLKHTATSSIQLAPMLQSARDLPQYLLNTAHPIVRRAGLRTRD